eukprot:1494280-Rhodomonas_salina.2
MHTTTLLVQPVRRMHLISRRSTDAAEAVGGEEEDEDDAQRKKGGGGGDDDEEEEGEEAYSTQFESVTLSESVSNSVTQSLTDGVAPIAKGREREREGGREGWRPGAADASQEGEGSGQPPIPLRVAACLGQYDLGVWWYWGRGMVVRVLRHSVWWYHSVHGGGVEQRMVLPAASTPRSEGARTAG